MDIRMKDEPRGLKIVILFIWAVYFFSDVCVHGLTNRFIAYCFPAPGPRRDETTEKKKTTLSFVKEEDATGIVRLCGRFLLGGGSGFVASSGWGRRRGRKWNPDWVDWLWRRCQPHCNRPRRLSRDTPPAAAGAAASSPRPTRQDSEIRHTSFRSKKGERLAIGWLTKPNLQNPNRFQWSVFFLIPVALQTTVLWPLYQLAWTSWGPPSQTCLAWATAPDWSTALESHTSTSPRWRCPLKTWRWDERAQRTCAVR